MNIDNTSTENAAEHYRTESRNRFVPDIDAFAEQYPSLNTELKNLLPLMQELQKLSEQQLRECDELFFDNLIPDDSDFRVLKKISNGGMGIVFEGIQLSLNRKVAIKFLSAELLKKTELRVQFEREAQLVALLHHPNIVKVLSAAFTPQYCYYVMEYVEGTSLHRIKAASAGDVARVGLASAQALAYAHSCGILHRDIKPANILIGKDGIIRLCDFGLADTIRKSNDNTASPLSFAGGGTLRYMAPEKIKGISEDEASDQYSLGATLYEYATGEPFTESPPLQMKSFLSRRGSTHWIFADKDLTAIIRKSLSPNPADRYRSMTAMVEDFRRYSEHKPVHAAKYDIAHRLYLWTKRKPIAALFAVCSALSVIAAVCVGVTGYENTRAALRQAQSNADLADEILSGVFSSIHRSQQTESNKKLLLSILPYYKKITRNTNLPDEQLYRANCILCNCAVNCADYAMAEKAARFMLQHSRNARNTVNLASILRKNGKQHEAEQLYRDCVSLYAGSENMEERAESVSALLELSESPQSAEYSQALQILQELHKKDGDNPEYAFRYACLLVANPNHQQKIRLEGLEATAYDILLRLSEKYPTRMDIGSELIKLTTKRVRGSKLFIQNNSQQVARVLSSAEQLLAQYPGDSDLLRNCIQLHDACRREYLRLGYNLQARKLTDRASAISEFLFFIPETSDEVRSLIIEFQLVRLESLARAGREDSMQELTDKVLYELRYIKGAKKQDLSDRLKAIRPQAADLPTR